MGLLERGNNLYSRNYFILLLARKECHDNSIHILWSPMIDRDYFPDASRNRILPPVHSQAHRSAHFEVNHSQNFVSAVHNRMHTNTIEGGQWSLKEDDKLNMRLLVNIFLRICLSHGRYSTILSRLFNRKINIWQDQSALLGTEEGS